MKNLYGVTSSLLGRVKDNSLPLHTNDVALANDFFCTSLNTKLLK